MVLIVTVSLFIFVLFPKIFLLHFITWSRPFMLKDTMASLTCFDFNCKGSISVSLQRINFYILGKIMRKRSNWPITEIVHHLHVDFNINDCSCQVHQKSGKIITYIHVDFNQPWNIIREMQDEITFLTLL